MGRFKKVGKKKSIRAHGRRDAFRKKTPSRGSKKKKVHSTGKKKVR